MGLSGCYTFLKYLVVLVNFIFWLAGLAVLGLAIWMLTDPTFYLSMAQAEDHYYIGIYIFLGVGALMFIMGFLGCCGAYKESPCMLVSFFCFLLIILVAEIAAGAWAYSHSDELETYLKENVKITIQEEYGVVDTRTITFDAIQKGLKCCGANGPKDWAGSKYNKDNKDKKDDKFKEIKDYIDVSVASLVRSYKIPASCCVNPDSTTCKMTPMADIGGIIPATVHSDGCINKLIEVLRQHMHCVIGIAIGVGIVELLGLIFSLFLCCAIRSVDRYKN